MTLLPHSTDNPSSSLSPSPSPPIKIFPNNSTTLPYLSKHQNPPPIHRSNILPQLICVLEPSGQPLRHIGTGGAGRNVEVASRVPSLRSSRTHRKESEVSMNSNKLSEIIKKWQKFAAKGRKGSKGHFVVYTKEGKRFVVPLYYLNHPIFRVLLEMAEEEFGPMVHGPLKVPCEEELMEYIVSLLKRRPLEDVEKVLASITTCRGASLSSFLPLCYAHDQRHDTIFL